MRMASWPAVPALQLDLKYSELCQDVKSELTASLVILAHAMMGYGVEDRHKAVEVWVDPSLAHLLEQLGHLVPGVGQPLLNVHPPQHRIVALHRDKVPGRLALVKHEPGLARRVPALTQ